MSVDTINDNGEQLGMEWRAGGGDRPLIVNLLLQTRTEYDPEELDALQAAMETDTPPYFELRYPVEIAEFDNPQSLIDYVRDHAEYHGIVQPDLDPRSYEQRDDGTWWILNEGHRRTIVAHRIAAKYGYVLTEDDIKKEITRNPGFDEMLAWQLRENSHASLSPVDRSRAIARYQIYMGKRLGTKPTIKQCARKLGFSETVVSNALLYDSLPDFVHADVNAKLYSYDLSLNFGPFMKAAREYCLAKYRDQYSGVSEDGRSLDKDVMEMLRGLTYDLKAEHLKDASQKKKADIIRARVLAMRGEASYQTGELFVIEEVAPKERAERAARAMGLYALSALMVRAQSGDGLSPEEIALLGKLNHHVPGAQVVNGQDLPDDYIPLF